MNQLQIISLGILSALGVGSSVGFVVAKMSGSENVAMTVEPNPVVAVTEPAASSSPTPVVTPSPKPVIKPSPVPPSQEMSDAALIQAVVDQQKKLKVCNFDFDREAAMRGSEVFAKNDNVYLVKLLCRMAAYQGVSTMVRVDASQADLKITSLNREFAGFPSFDPSTKIVSNSYKFNGPGVCRQNTQYHWNGYSLRLVNSTLEDGIANGCEKFGVKIPLPSFLITKNSVGKAKIGMTFGALKQALGKEASFEPTALGVDLGRGLTVKQYGEVQFDVRFADDRPIAQQNPDTVKITDQSIIDLIFVRNPNYRTQAGVGPGTLIKDAIAQYGTASFAYNYENEGREYVQFERGQDLVMRTNQGTLTTFAGIYPESTRKRSYQKTNRYHDHAAIGMISIMKR
ncbi:DUF1176 domain-containing protein [filamentous cyanobacterium LEGE 11480]|uniref:DUF1176 domain-containing protein n=1 Tax=Romeriopsis navalis LEGE 11480 TaxID=2777977 RepID=A0A928VSS5_9CYAN|nr:DUF1176 domain-containing protein [Romeriopsis navalis]MBE9031559.1 DUF1176 domain-containing protein [Romeriopsis navalis LEGE 11480]